MSDIIIDIQRLTRVYRLDGVEVRALNGVSIQIERGEFVSIMGSSGSGKSTLMHVLGCLDRPTSGRYVFEGVDTAELPDRELARIRSSRIGFVFQSFNLLARTSAIENVALPLFYSAAGPARRAIRFARARDALHFVGLAGKERNSPSQLSGGQQQRVAIARALISDPGLLLADEPTGNLDTRTSHEIMAMLRSLNRDHGMTIVVVTHEPDIAAFTDRIVTMRDGCILSDERRRQSQPRQSPSATSLSPGITSAPASPSLQAARPLLGFAAMILTAAAQALGRNKMRSALTMLGVFIGVAALIAMVAVGQGANEAVRKQIETLGTNLVVIVPGATTSGGVRAGSGSASTLTVGDALALQREAPAVSAVSYLIRQIGQVEYGSRNWSTNIQGVTPSYLETANWHVAAGQPIAAADDRNASMIALIGQTVYQQLFIPGENPVGAMILVKGKPVRVAGLLAAKGQSTYGQDQDDVLMLPFSAAEQKVVGVAVPSQTQAAPNPYFPPVQDPYGLTPHITGYVNQIYVQAVSPQQVPSAITQTTEILRRRHHIRPGETGDFAVRNLSQIAETAESSSHIMAMLLATIASISLLVGGIGIMNILLVSVTERTREIGLRMAIGARRLQVLLQFLVEAVFLSVTGGVAGILFGIVASELITIVARWPTLLSPAAVAGGFVFSAAVGIFFGYYPARKASHLDPIEALRYE